MGRHTVGVVLFVTIAILYISAIALVVSQAQTADAIAPIPYRPLDSREFRPLTAPPIYEPVVAPVHRPPQLRPAPRAQEKTERSQVGTSRGSSATGKASWYCRAGVSICHHAYPPGSMVAAACRKLRIAMGPSWRGDSVTVSSGGRTVTVKLVDWCGSTTKLIDLYWEPMRRLGGTGVLSVTVRWR